jgi:hypothetical protein
MFYGRSKQNIDRWQLSCHFNNSSLLLDFQTKKKKNLLMAYWRCNEGLSSIFELKENNVLMPHSKRKLELSSFFKLKENNFLTAHSQGNREPSLNADIISNIPECIKHEFLVRLPIK